MAVTLETLKQTYELPLTELLFQAQVVHREHHKADEVQLCTLSNIKSGNCPEDCGYCPQSVHYKTGIETWDLPPLEEIERQVACAKQEGATRFCMGAAWRTPPHRQAFDRVLDYIRTVRQADMEACVTLGMLTADQAKELKAAGLTAYNHNLDTAPDYYQEIISTRTYEDRLETLGHVADAGIDVCCGGILGMGESIDQRLRLIETLCGLATPPESVPINCLVPVEGTPLAQEDLPPVDPIELARLVAVTRIYLPDSRIRLSAGRLELSDEAQALCFMAGANSIFSGDVLLTTPNPGASRDHELLAKLGLQPATQPKTADATGKEPLLV